MSKSRSQERSLPVRLSGYAIAIWRYMGQLGQSYCVHDFTTPARAFGAPSSADEISGMGRSKPTALEEER
ncbi:hypothetical protein [Rhizobium leguminosarum]|uniref:hypothetical protein n=1 Tax=Rhizobium leguminosarum TaxID=384 RepID=UPI00103EA7FC|nr:hypothetical protein [Rhizobium leguminosarum]TCA52897.1 hypothetical protein E0H71_16680 [Rhizobium leguminosarum bv. viciae]TCA68250.1 hypothetical protein E0H69_30895 [Rhizobium leguminosarum bv. viciae]TCA82336.1 hypothetical protein E0H74_21290 [Rhizobium leguminosarum bv. viciae]TCA92799.1 hypothetical protein E0H76_22640 [Rhizobium leguminosarum bv. viciae]